MATKKFVFLSFFCSHRFEIYFIFEKVEKYKLNTIDKESDPEPTGLYLWLTDPAQDPAPNPAIFVSDLQESKKN